MAIERLLIAVGTAADDLGEVPASVRHLIEEAERIMVVSPALPKRWEWLASDTDKTVEKADERLRTVLGQLEDEPVVAAEVGADEPLLAFTDAAREFPPDHVIVAMRAGDRADWQEHGLIDQLLEKLNVPVTVFQIDPRA